MPVGGPDMVADGQWEAATAAPAALASLDQPSRTAGVAASAEKAAAPAAPSSASCATPQEAPWIVVMKDGAVEAAATKERHAGVAACGQCCIIRGKEIVGGHEVGDFFPCLECPWCNKAFKGPEFVIQHVQNNHARNFVQVASEHVATCLSHEG